MTTLQAVKGMNDVLPAESASWQRLESAFRSWTVRYGYREIRTPIVEPTALFLRSIGDTTDIVEKEMYSFVDKGEHSLALRPEGTASAVRAVLEHNLVNLEPVSKLTYIGPMFRRERPAKGRYRQFHQAGAELFGDPGPYSDAEMIDMLVGFLDSVGIRDIEVLVNSLGGPSTRPAYRDALVAYLEPQRSSLCADCQRRLDSNPLRVLDCKVEGCKAIAKDAPTVIEFLSDEDRAHFEGLKKTLDTLGTPYRIEPRLVRGLDYYTRTLFEIKGRGGELGAQDTICGGGRYDGLVEQLGGPSTPAIGFGIGLERLRLMTNAAPEAQRVDAFIVSGGPAELPAATLLARELRHAGLVVDADLRGQSFKSQLRRADKLSARFALIVGDREIASGTVQVKDLVQKTQTEVPRADACTYIVRTLGETK